jgi:alcohol dehydrogenase (cytochrome c)
MQRGRLLLVLVGLAVCVAMIGGNASGAPAVGTRGAVEHTPAPAFTTSDLNQVPNGNWITAGGNIWSQRYSQLDQINATNVSGLKQAWKTNLDGSGKAAKYSAEGTPIVYNGVMYISTGNNDIFALDATTGAHLWKYESKITQKNNTVCCGWVSRGLGFGEGKIYSAQLDGWLVALDQKTGTVVWKIRNVRWQEGLTMTMPPVYYKGLLFVGMSGGEFGARGHMTAYHASDGTFAWRYYTCPQPGDIGGATWASGEWATCGSTIWSYPAIDSTTDTMYFTTSNADPWVNRGPGQNLFSASLVALDSMTGQYVNHFQMVHHDIWDYDCPSPPILFDVNINGELRKGVGEACKTGWLYLLDRETMEPLVGIVEKKVPQSKEQNTWPTQPYPVGDAFAQQCPTKSMFSGKAPDGKPFKLGCIFTPVNRQQFTALAPGALGGTNWPPISFNPQTNFIYVCSGNMQNALKAVPVAQLNHVGGQGFTGVLFSLGKAKGLSGFTGNFTALDARTNKIAWRKNWPQMCASGSFTTGGGLVFTGQPDGTYIAFNAMTGDQLWSQKLEAGVNAPGVTYTVNGKQYVAIFAGGGTYFDAKLHGDAVYAFALG